MHIKFKTIKWRNLLSTGNTDTVIDLAISKTTLLVGKNGEGKSTILDALSFGLYGKPFRKVNKSQLVNAINKKDLRVEVAFDVGTKSYTVIRGIKPAIFEIYCNGTLLNQNAESKDYQEVLESSILRMNHKSFFQIVVLGSASFTPFMQLTAQNRREIIEDLLNIQVFTTMNLLLKEKVQANRESLTEAAYQLKGLMDKMEMQRRHDEQMQVAVDEQIAVHQQNIQKHKDNNAQLQALMSSLLGEIEEMRAQTTKGSQLKTTLKEHTALLHQLKAKQRQVVDTASFIKDHDNCPTCLQSIHGDHRESVSHKCREQEVELAAAIEQIETKIDKVSAKLDRIDRINSAIQSKRSAFQIHESSVKSNDRFIETFEYQIRALQAPLKRSVGTLSLADMEQEYQVALAARESLEQTKQTYAAASVLLKDGGIKSKIIKQYVPVMNKLINKYLAAMDFYISFELNENFEETIRSRFREDFSYSSFSEGEKARLDLALVFTWRALSKMRNTSSTNLLLLDEVFDGSLDNAGNEELLKILQTAAPDNNIIVISHKTDAMMDKFDRVLVASKTKNFSQIMEHAA